MEVWAGVIYEYHISDILPARSSPGQAAYWKRKGKDIFWLARGGGSGGAGLNQQQARGYLASDEKAGN